MQIDDEFTFLVERDNFDLVEEWGMGFGVVDGTELG